MIADKKRNLTFVRVPPLILTPEVTSNDFHVTEGYEWGILGLCGGLLIVLFPLLIYRWIRGRYAVHKAKPNHDEESLDCFARSTAEKMNSTTDDSMENSLPHIPLRRIHPSLSADICTPFTKAHTVKTPQPSLTTWNSLSSPRLSLISLGAVQPDLCRSSDSEEQASPPCCSGQICFSVLFRKEDGKLEVTLIQAKYLPSCSFNRGTRNPFVKVFLLPDEENFQQSKICKRTLTPKFNESFIFNVKPEELSSRYLRFSVYDIDKRKVRHSLGHAIVSLEKLDTTNNKAIWMDLERISQFLLQHRNYKGDIQISLVCNPYNNRLKVSVCKVKNIKSADNGNAYVYIKVQLFHGRKLMKTKKTTLQHCNWALRKEIIFHESFSFSVPARFYDSCSIRFVTVIAREQLTTKNVSHGQVTIGPFLFSRGEQLLHWQEMVTNSRSLITRWHKLEAPHL